MGLRRARFSELWDRPDDPTLGGGWVGYTDPAVTMLALVAGAVQAAAPDLPGVAVQSQAQPANQFAYTRIVAQDPTGASAVGIVLRASAADPPTFYALTVSATAVTLLKSVAGVVTGLAAATLGGRVGDYIDLEVTDTLLTGRINQQIVVRAFDTDIAAGRIGVLVRTDTGAAVAGRAGAVQAGRVQVGTLDPDTAVKQYRIESQLDLPSDQFSLVLAAPDAALGGGDPLVHLELGFTDDAAQIKASSQIRDGLPWEFEVTATPASALGTIAGYDAGRGLLDAHINILYKYIDPTEPVDADAEPLPEVTPGTKGEPTVKRGQYGVRDVVRDCEAIAGFRILWAAPTYQFEADVLAQGRIIDVLRQLVSPFSQPEPFFKVDFFFGPAPGQPTGSNGTLHVRQRYPGAAGVVYRTTIAAAQVERLVRTRRRAWTGGKPGWLLGVGRRKKPSPPQLPGMWGFVDDVLLQDEGGVEVRARIQDMGTSYAKTLYQRTDTYRTDGSYFSRTIPISTEEIENTWETTNYGPFGPTNAPKKLSAVVKRWGIDEDKDPNKQWRLLYQEERTYRYTKTSLMPDGFLGEERALKKQLNWETFTFDEFELEITVATSSAPLTWTSSTSRYVPLAAGFYDASNPAGGGPPGEVVRLEGMNWVLVSRTQSENPGHPPGGPGRVRGGTAASGGERERVAVAVPEGDPNFVLNFADNPHLTLGHLHAIADQYKQAVRFNWDVELAFTALAIPWLARGDFLEFTTPYQLLNGAKISFEPALVTELNFTYDEEAASMTMSGRVSYFSRV